MIMQMYGLLYCCSMCVLSGNPSPSLQYFTFHFFPTAPSLASSLFFYIYSFSLFAFFFPSSLYLSFLCDLQDTVIFLTRYFYLPPPSCTFSLTLIPHHLSLLSFLHRSIAYLSFSLLPSHCFSLLSDFFSLSSPILRSLPLFISLLPMLTLLLAECSVGNRHLSRQISVSPLACWKRFSKNTAKGYITTYACVSTHTHTLSFSLSCVCVSRGLHTGHAGVSHMVLPSFRDKP